MTFDLYTWLKGLHVASALLFVGGLTAEMVVLSVTGAIRGGAPPTPEQRRIAVAVRRWHLWLTSPAVMAVWIFGLVLGFSGGWFASGWLQGKLILVLLLSALHGILAGRLRRIAAGNAASRLGGWAVTALVGSAAAIPVLAVVKPF